jgi:hypothetical protein
MIISGSMPDLPGKRKKRKPTMGIPDAPRVKKKRKPIVAIPDAPKKAIPVGATKATPVTGKIDPRPTKPIPVGAKPAGTNAIPDAPRKAIPSGAKPVGTVAMPDRPRRRKPVNPNDPNLQKMKPTGGTQFQGTMTSTSEALKPNEGTSTMQAAANIAGQFKKRLSKKI